jgi:hypothetical protein
VRSSVINAVVTCGVVNRGLAYRVYNCNGITLTLSETPCGGGLEYLHCIPASRKRRHKGNPVPEGITGSPCSWGI